MKNFILSKVNVLYVYSYAILWHYMRCNFLITKWKNMLKIVYVHTISSNSKYNFVVMDK